MGSRSPACAVAQSSRATVATSGCVGATGERVASVTWREHRRPHIGASLNVDAESYGGEYHARVRIAAATRRRELARWQHIRGPTRSTRCRTVYTHRPREARRTHRSGLTPAAATRSAANRTAVGSTSDTPEPALGDRFRAQTETRKRPMSSVVVAPSNSRAPARNTKEEIACSPDSPRFCFRHRRIVVVLWLLAFVVAIVVRWRAQGRVRDQWPAARHRLAIGLRHAEARLPAAPR